MTSLFERLGGEDGIVKISNDIVENHNVNPLIKARFESSDHDKLKKMVSDFFITGSGGPACYEGEGMLAVHKGMNISDNEYMAAVDDVMKALDSNGIGDQEKSEVLYIFYQLRPEVVAV
ncbi:group I truncated hemoglobin [Pseudemcibacter aquimaris]|uniref:group I truncated hemoglobin n=1 Tax=Pseudemcibacter aquimaris TaxID=2857064 RepID=UPI00201145B9|nr:group 1 truncated hemoglobin [Pseudemcibacter aquimaris]MCC3860366.1 group 1 truncated hemoglobin [Pseudemcibacter aquimaris]WDU57692.1 group 1 truncated hemoglobin [Pseudemcibacter aquimaris]